jgi:hypothetical protein
MQSVVIHAHFYQPPREDPWTEVVEREHSAAPWHDWNRRIEQECYRPLGASRLLDTEGRIRRVINCLEHISFNVGATLLEWLEEEAPATYAAILAADRTSRARVGHGNALAMPYHHIILPLASRRDKVTEVRWGIRDFERRFGRAPEGMWLPETAVDEETLDVLAQEGIRFTVLSPHQVVEAPLHGLPGAFRTSGGHRLAVFLYDGALAHDVAFGPLLRDAPAWADRMVLPPDDLGGAKLVSIATDGETFGHHHKFAEMALAAVIERLGSRVRIENYASFLAAHPPHHSVHLAAPSSWSCSHGVERWRSDCGCRMEAGTSQAWRRPLRQALDWLKEALDQRFEVEGRGLLGDPWAARDAADPGMPADTALPGRGRELLEMQRNALRMFTSCAWFFDDPAGLEVPQALRYAVVAAEYAADDTPRLLAGLRERLSAARSNDPTVGTIADLMDRRVLRAHAGAERTAAGVAALARHAPVAVPLRLGTFEVRRASAQGVTIRHLLTGTEHRYRTTVGDRVTDHLPIQLVNEASGAICDLTLADVPEPARELLRRHVQARLIPDVLDRGEREGVAAGVVAYGDALRVAMLRHLGEDAAHANLEALGAALDLLALDRRPVPFEVQTRLYRIYSEAGTGGRARLAPLLPAFGFSAALLTDEPAPA